jgi:4'-phosphopantetheinyl transferase
VPPAPDEVHVWLVDLDRPPCGAGELTAALTPLERDRAERYRAVPVRQQFVVGRGLLRRLLGGYLGVAPHAVPITYTEAGKPVLAGGAFAGDPGRALHFNLTHTTGLALIAVAARRVGVDVERVRHIPDADGLIERFFSPAERAAYRGLPEAARPAAFYRGWTCKEAVIKAAGASVQCLDGFDVELDPARPPAVLAVWHPALAGVGWAVGDWEPAPGFAAAVAVEGVGGVRVAVGGV